MPQIIVLPEHIASQIAAGEVVERPASVIKELVENSIDAGATKIVIDISEGCRHIRVADNGCGMAANDASLAFQRHATSKLTNAADLWNLHTLGFRGEALPSIAAISRLTCSTHTENQDIGTQVICLDGNMTVTETGCAKGTVIEVEDLFYNVPARLKFLKKPATEFAHIHEIVQSLAITYPNIAFELKLDSNTRFKTLGSGNLDQALQESGFFTKDNELITLKAIDSVLGTEIEGRLVSALNFRGDRKGILTIVNSRPVRCALTYKALDYAYADLIPKGRYPLAVIHLKVSPADLDINIHPTKKEIRYSKGNDIYLFIQRQIMHALHRRQSSEDVLDFTPQKNNLAYKLDNALDSSEQLSIKETANAYNPIPPAAHSTAALHLLLDSVNIAAAIRSTAAAYADPVDSIINAPESSPTITTTPSIPTNTLPLDWRIAGYIHNTYILIETKSGLSIVEQHIAHERTLYEQLLNKKSKDEAQQLLISLPLNLTAEQKSTLEDNLAELNAQGFEFEIADKEIHCTQVPIELAHKDYASIIQNMLQELAESSNANPKLEIIKSIACQAAIKNGMPLAQNQIIELLSLWQATPRNDTCPHGRPIQLHFSWEKLFQLYHPQ